MNSKLQSIALALALTATQANADKCYALALSSGDQSAAYQAGVLSGLFATQSADQSAYTAVSGMSGGAVNAAILGSYGIGNENSAAERMITFWQNSSNTKLYKDWLGGIVQGLTLEGGLYNNALLKTFLTKELVDIGPMQRFVDIGITDVLTGKYQDNLPADIDTNLIEILFASFAFAGFFPPAESMGTSWFDGAVIWDLDIFSAVNKCLETHSPQDVVVDVILTSTKTLKTVDASNYNSVQMLIRFLEVQRYYSVMDGLLRAQFAYPEISFRHIISPSADLPSNLYPLNMDQSQIDQIVALGRQDGINAAQTVNHTQNAQDTLHFFSLKTQRDQRVNGLTYEAFLEKKANGDFPSNYSVLADTNLQNLFLH